MAWTTNQQAAIDSRGQTLLLSAAAGSGKTAVLVERIIRRLLDKSQPIDVTELLIVTFTNAAAAEMRERVASALSQALAETGDPAVERQLALLPSAHISTIHSFCKEVVRRYFYMIDIDPAFTIAGDEELRLLRNDVLKNLFLLYYEDEEKAPLIYPLADMFASDRGDDELTDVISKIYDYSRSMPWPDVWLSEAAAAYVVPESAVIDELPWCGPVKAHIRKIAEEQYSLYKAMLRDIQGLASFEPVYDSLAAEAETLADILECRRWDDFFRAVSAVEFSRLKGLRNLSDGDKMLWEKCKNRRKKVKEKFNETIRTPYFSVLPEQWFDGMNAMAPVMASLVRLTSDFAELYRKAKKERGWIDFNDLEHFCLQVLMDPSSTPDRPVPSLAAEELRRAYAEVLIDEYQDTNGVQELITTLISGVGNRFMVGDIKQSIYRFRLADPTLFLEKYKTFSRDEAAVERCIDLGKNFRSAPNILDAVNAVFRRAMTEDAAGMDYGKREMLYAGRTVPDDGRWVGGPIEIHIVNTKKDSTPAEEDDDPEQDMTAFEKECHVIADRLVAMKAAGKMAARKDGTLEPLTYRHMAVLLRSMAGKADMMLRVFRERGIPAYAEQNGGYFAAVEVQTMLSLLRCIDNPEQDLAMAAVLRSPLVAMREKSLALLRLSGCGTLWQNLPVYAASLEEGEEKEKLCRFMQRFDSWRTYSRRHGVAELLHELYKQTGYYDYLGGMAGGTVRQANLQALYDRARRYESSGFRGLFRYLRLMDKMKEDGLDLAPAKVLSEREDVVRIMSIHKSKGLEFPVVVVADMGKQFNQKDEVSSVLFHKQLGIGIKQYDSIWRMVYPTLPWCGIRSQNIWENTAEEERVLYVAMTRARDKLILTGHSAKLESDWLRWTGGVSPAQARSYFDWVIPAAADGLAGAAGFEALENQRYICRDDGLWRIAVYYHAGGSEGADGKKAAEPRLEALRRGELTGTEIPPWFDETLLWKYGYGHAAVTAAKMSVSEIKRRYNQQYRGEWEEEQLAIPLGETFAGSADEDVFGQLPPWLSEDADPVSGAQRGTAVHKAMQYIDIRNGASRQAVRAQLEQWKKDGIFSAEESALVHVPALVQFCRSPLGRRMAASPDVRREYSFSALLPGGGYLPVLEEGEKILVQGVIDCLFRDGSDWVLVDYKTDRLEDEEAFRKRYAVQLALYRQAAEQIGGFAVREAYIYSFCLGKAIAV